MEQTCRPGQSWAIGAASEIELENEVAVESIFDLAPDSRLRLGEFSVDITGQRIAINVHPDTKTEILRVRNRADREPLLHQALYLYALDKAIRNLAEHEGNRWADVIRRKLADNGIGYDDELLAENSEVFAQQIFQYPLGRMLPLCNGKATMTEPMNIPRLTDEAFRTLVNLADARPELWLDPEADFAQVLAENGITRYAEPASVTADDLYLAPPDHPPRPRADRQALDWSQQLHGMTLTKAADPNLLAWLNHFVLHQYGTKRWPLVTRANPVSHIRRHWLTEQPNDIWESSIAGRTWWIAETCRRAAEYSGGAFTAQQALEHFSENAENYHNSVQFNLMRNPLLLAECIRALLNEATGISTVGYRQVVRQLNREAGALLLDALDRQQIRNLIVKIVEQTMTEPEWVRDRQYLRNRNITRVLSLGAGTQSTVLALMAEQGYGGISRPDFAIFADTGWEPLAVYQHLEWLKSELSYEVVTVSAGNIKENILAGTNPEGGKFLDLPAFLINLDGNESISARQCTRHYKLTADFSGTA